jgi:hypothetical protein
MRGRHARTVLAVAVLSLSLGVPVALADDDQIQPIDFTHNAFDAPAPVAGAVFGTGPATKTGSAICTTPTQATTDVNTDCEGVNPHNETSITVDPTNTKNLLGGANDYQLALNPGGHESESILSRAHVSTDGGKTWSEYPVFSNSAYQATGDPSVAYDAAGHAYYSTLGFRFVGPTNAQNADILVSNSADKGKTWTVKRVAQGSGNFGSVGESLDKEYIAAWGTGNVLVVWGDFHQAQKGAVTGAQIYSSVSHDSGDTWSKPQVISGSLDQAFVATPVVAKDGKIYVSFLNTTDLNTGRDDYEVVQVDPATGARLAGPFKVATTVDGATDYPIADGRQTYQDSLFRTWAAGNIAADPTNAAHLAVVWSDMRDSPTPAPSDPYVAKTNSDVVVSQSFDSGRTWSAPKAIALAGDQWMPWSAYDQTGHLRIGTFDRSIDPANHMYVYRLLQETAPGALVFTTTKTSTATSDPTRDNTWFKATENPAFPNANRFIGDYSNIAVMPDGSGIVAYWTDLRNQACFNGTCGHGEDAYFTHAP